MSFLIILLEKGAMFEENGRQDQEPFLDFNIFSILAGSNLA
jgi:hypothetical protein